MKKIKNKRKRRRLKPWIKITLIVLGIVLILFIVGFICYKLFFSDMFKNDSDKDVDVVVKEELELDNYKYYINSSACRYEKKVFDELKNILSQKEINNDEYAKALAKVFVSDLFTLSSKNNSSDIPSSQYVFDEYKDTYKIKVKDTIYSTIQLNLSGDRVQDLPEVENVEIVSVDRTNFSLKGKVIDSQAYNIKVNISYVKDLGYPTSYRVILAKNNDLLQVVKLGK